MEFLLFSYKRLCTVAFGYVLPDIPLMGMGYLLNDTYLLFEMALLCKIQTCT